MFKERYGALLLNCEDLNEFCKITGLKYHTAYARVVEHYPEFMKRKEENRLIVDSYIKRGLTVKEIASITGKCHQTIRNRCSKLGVIPIGPGSGGQNAKVTSNIFNNSLESEYWIGFILADGNLSKVKYSISVTQTESDRDVIDKFVKFVDKDLTIHFKTYTLQSGEKRRMCTALFSNKASYFYLKSIGFTPNKSNTIKLSIPLTWAIIAGWFDGDGHVSIKSRCIKITTGSFAMVLLLKEFYDALGMQYTVCPKGRCFDIKVLHRSKLLFINSINSLNIPRLARKYNSLASLAVMLEQETV